jgi:hypothetical protein
MTPAEYVNEIVEPTIKEFRDEPRSRRRAYLACIVTFQIKEHLVRAGENKSDVHAKMKQSCRDAFELVRSICNGSKHVETDKSHLFPFRAGSDWDRPPARCGVAQAGLSRVGDATGAEKRAQAINRWTCADASRRWC